MLDYTLEFLASSGVQEVFVFCCHLADQIRTHISNSRWSENGSSMVVKPVLAEGCLSVGDALREIDAKSLIKNDFFLVSGDVIANLNLKAIMEEHKKRREKTKSSVMTMLFKKVMPAHRTRCADDNILLAVDPTTQRVYHYQKTGLDKNPKIPVEVFDENPDIIIHQDLMDCQLCVCTPAVPPLFTDNFDYSSLDDFVRGILINEEILGNTIHISVVREEYCARVTNPYMYDAVSRDVIQRWVCPLTAESMIGDRKDPISVRRHNIYLSKDVMLARGCILEENIVISSGSSVQNGTRISNCVIGKNCKIGANVTLDSCYLWDGVVIEDSCVINGAIVCNNVTVYSNTRIQPRTILSTNVKVGPDVVLPADIRLQAHPSVDEFDNDDKRQEVPETTPEYGVKSRAFRFQAEVESDDEGEQVGCEWGEALVPRDEESEDDADSLADSDMDENSLPSESPEHDDLGTFYLEVLDTLKRAQEEAVSTENLVLEINSLKHAYNIDISDVHHVVIKSVVDLPLRESERQGPAAIQSVCKHIDHHLSLIRNYIKSADAQIDCLNSLEEFALNDSLVLQFLMKVVHHLYDTDILDESVILSWFQSPSRMHDLKDHSRVREQLKEFIRWLKEAEEESSEED
ncbi:hypothetical protein C0Q70_06310 [Pomacea canaliculata]|uniref:Translation initiation factor eIF2B subunit epsilon n=2 Tax=Pomacea canaliculata TaxID=400727 RepID=A0A2T7PNN2_POMCA|nr:hypothetical protein C0Q70_06310 [Pomacea canaliculata]